MESILLVDGVIAVNVCYSTAKVGYQTRNLDRKLFGVGSCHLSRPLFLRSASSIVDWSQSRVDIVVRKLNMKHPEETSLARHHMLTSLSLRTPQRGRCAVGEAQAASVPDITLELRLATSHQPSQTKQ